MTDLEKEWRRLYAEIMLHGGSQEDRARLDELEQKLKEQDNA